MDSQTTNHTSKPKVHRLPQPVAKESSLYISRVALMVCFALLMIAVIPVMLSYKKNNEKQVKIEVAAEREGGTLPEAVSNNVVVHDEKGEIMGQLSKMPTDDQQLMQVKTVKNVDSNTGKELLGIIGKY